MASLIFTVIQIALAFWLSPNITIFVLISGVFIVFLNRKFLKRSLALGNRNYELARQFYAGTTDQINGIKDIKSNSLEESRMQWFRTITKNMESEQVEYLKLKTTSQLYYKLASSLLMIIFIFVAIKMFQAQAGQLMLIIVIFGRLWPRVAGIQSSLEQIATTLPSFKAVKRLQEECQQAEEFLEQENIKSLDLQKGIECRNIHFRYNKNERTYALKDINLWIPSMK